MVFSELARNRGDAAFARSSSRRARIIDEAKATLEALGLWVYIEQARRRSGKSRLSSRHPQTLRGELLARFITWMCLGKATVREFIELPKAVYAASIRRGAAWRSPSVRFAQAAETQACGDGR